MRAGEKLLQVRGARGSWSERRAYWFSCTSRRVPSHVKITTSEDSLPAEGRGVRRGRKERGIRLACEVASLWASLWVSSLLARRTVWRD